MACILPRYKKSEVGQELSDLHREIYDKARNSGLFVETEQGLQTLEETPIQEGFQRLYRSNAIEDTTGLPDWIKSHPEFQQSAEAEGRWYYSTRKEAEDFLKDFDGKNISYVDVPIADFEKYRVSNQEDIRKHAAPGRDKEEFFLPKAIANTSKLLNSKFIQNDFISLTNSRYNGEVLRLQDGFLGINMNKIGSNKSEQRQDLDLRIKDLYIDTSIEDLYNEIQRNPSNAKENIIKDDKLFDDIIEFVEQEQDVDLSNLPIRDKIC